MRRHAEKASRLSGRWLNYRSGIKTATCCGAMALLWKCAKRVERGDASRAWGCGQNRYSDVRSGECMKTATCDTSGSWQRGEYEEGYLQSLGRIGAAVMKDRFIVPWVEWDERGGQRWRFSGECGQISEVQWRKSEKNAMSLDEREGLGRVEGFAREWQHGLNDAYAIPVRRGLFGRVESARTKREGTEVNYAHGGQRGRIWSLQLSPSKDLLFSPTKWRA